MQRRAGSWLAAALSALAAALLPLAPARAGEDLTGHYVIVEGYSPGAGAFYGGTVDVTPRRSGTCAVNWQLDGGKRLRGLGLRDNDDLLGVTLNTGSAAYGLIVCRREPGGNRWRGRWITSLDGGGTPGEMTIETPAADGTVSGRCRFTGRRGGAGAFGGSIAVTPRGDGLALNFASDGGVALYRGIGLVSGDRLVIAWNFGGTPSLALYELNPKHGLTGRRLTLPRGGADASAGSERLAREGSDEVIFPPRLPTLAPPSAPAATPAPKPRRRGR